MAKIDQVPVTGAFLAFVGALHAARTLYINESSMAEDLGLPKPPEDYWTRCEQLFLRTYAAQREAIGLASNAQTFAALMTVVVPEEARGMDFAVLPRTFVFDPWAQMGRGGILRIAGEDATQPPASEAPKRIAGIPQQYVPGEGEVYEVPVTVDTTMTALVRVRAADKPAAMELARQLACDGGALFELDEGNCRTLGDYYVPDEDAVRLVGDAAPAAEKGSPSMRARCGAYEVTLSDLPDVDDRLLSADLTVFYPGEPSDEPQNEFCLSSFGVDTPAEEGRAICRRLAEMLNRVAPNPNSVDWQALRHSFTSIMQGGVVQNEVWGEIEDKLRSQVR